MSSNTTTGEAYIHSLKQIKELEEKVQAEIESHKRLVDEEMPKIDLQFKGAVAQAKLDGEKIVEQAVEQARQRAQKEAEKITLDAHNRSKNLRLNEKAAKQVIDILLSGL